MILPRKERQSKDWPLGTTTERRTVNNDYDDDNNNKYQKQLIRSI